MTPRDFRNAFLAAIKWKQDGFRTAALAILDEIYRLLNMRTTIYPRVATTGVAVGEQGVLHARWHAV